MTPDEIEKDRTKAAMCAPDPHARDYKAAMLYHSDRADAYMTERDALTAENAALKERVARLEEGITEANDLLRSAHSVASRAIMHEEFRVLANWDAFYNRISAHLKRFHDLTNSARAALEKRND